MTNPETKWEKRTIGGMDPHGVPITRGRRMRAFVKAKKYLRPLLDRALLAASMRLWGELDEDTRAVVWAAKLDLLMAEKQADYALDAECLWWMIVLGGDPNASSHVLYEYPIDLTVPPPPQVEKDSSSPATH